MNQKLFSLALILLVSGGLFTLQGCQKVEVKRPVACTEEAKVCPDGSAVGRTGPDCSFAPCPQVESPKPCTLEAKLCPDGSSVGRTGADCSFAPCPLVKPPVVPSEPPSDPVKEPTPSDGTSVKTTPYGKPVSMRVNDSVVFPDGMTLKLKEINDSRCPAGVQCIWQGELSPLFIATQNGASDEVRLGTVRGSTLSLKGRNYTLVGANGTGATVRVDLVAIP
ncbi:hypothetical protein HZA44_04085 [Candidatus Peregrinibacteria bacterium]|nr:hypothetical protein [Candidatus Peregrinibacteria bacterium]